jgi:hypothetical protein
MFQLETKYMMMEHRMKCEQGRPRYAAKERALVLQLQMQEKEFAYKERMMQNELELARLKARTA